jgi:hypothetical protein
MTSTEGHLPEPRRTEVDPVTSALTSALHNAFQSVTPPTHHHADRHDPTYKKDDKLPSIEIIVDSDTPILRGTGAEVTPALLSGRVVLHLAESTPVKQITLHFRGKAKLPPLANEPSVP